MRRLTVGYVQCCGCWTPPLGQDSAGLVRATPRWKIVLYLYAPHLTPLPPLAPPPHIHYKTSALKCMCTCVTAAIISSSAAVAKHAPLPHTAAGTPSSTEMPITQGIQPEVTFSSRPHPPTLTGPPSPPFASVFPSLADPKKQVEMSIRAAKHLAHRVKQSRRSSRELGPATPRSPLSSPRSSTRYLFLEIRLISPAPPPAMRSDHSPDGRWTGR